MSDSKKDKGKNIVVFSDGTGQEGGVGYNTNVYKIFNMIEDRTEAQTTFYDRGLGTRWRKYIGGATGAGITNNILECYQFISDNYRWGDRIFLFGFSRGAATVRSLSGFISLFGILPHSRPELSEWAYRIYKMSNQNRNREKEARAFLERNNTTYCNIHFLGVWDTVSALGLPWKRANAFLDKIPWFKNKFHDLRIGSRVHHAYHALAIDEERIVFSPTPWVTHDGDKSLLRMIPTDPREGDAREQKGKDRRQTVRQVWFCGVHTDVGGGYQDHRVSDIPLAWMLDRAMDHGLLLYPYNGVDLKQDVEWVIHDSRLTRKDKRLFPGEPRKWDVKACGKPVIHASVLERKHGLVQTGESPKDRTAGEPAVDTRDIPYNPWILQQFKEGEYEIEPWDNKGLEDIRYGINIEHEYRSDYDDPEKGYGK